jgi:hypothetical protein
MTDEELIAELRKLAWSFGNDAADRIEALVKERDHANACNRGLVRLNEATQARAEAAEAALFAFIREDNGCAEPCPGTKCGCQLETATALQGDKP